MKHALAALVLAFFSGVSWASWDTVSEWRQITDGKSKIELTSVNGKTDEALQLRADLVADGWVVIAKDLADGFPRDRPLSFWIKAASPSFLEVKAVDEDGSNFLKKIALKDKYSDWARVTVGRETLEYGWGGNEHLGDVTEIAFAVSGGGSGVLWLDQIEWGQIGEKASFPPAGPLLDPDRALPGIGVRQRRAKDLVPEDPLVLEWIKANQNISSPKQALVSSMEDNIAQTFNNALAAMVFVLKGEKVRAERILDFYSGSARKDSADPALQNFFLNGQARGFYQNMLLTGPDASRTLPNGDRWVGDIAWLLMAYKHYEREYGPARYLEISAVLKDFLISIFRRDGPGGYIPSGWSYGDKEFRTVGYGEPNIDAMAALTLCGEERLAYEIRKWLDSILKGDRLPLDNYSWRVLAYGKEAEGYNT